MNGEGFAGRTARLFIDSKLTPLLIVATLALGAYAVVVTPREDQPTIEVPRAQVFIPLPGAGTRVVDQRVALPASTWIHQIDSVTELETTALPDGALFSVTFESGLDRSTAYSQLTEQLAAHASELPQASRAPTVRMVGLEDVVSVVFTLWSAERSPYELRRLGLELAERLQEVPEVRAAEVLGGYRRELRVELDLPTLADRRIAPGDVVEAIQAARTTLPADVLQGPSGAFRVVTGSRLRTAEDLGDVLVGGPTGPVSLRTLARIVDAPAEAAAYASFGGRASGGRDVPAVSLAVTNMRGSNVSAVAERVRSRMRTLEPVLVPADVQVSVAFDAGRDAAEAVETILHHLLLAIVIVLAVIAIGLGLRAGLIIAVVIPLVLAIVPAVYLMAGITLNEISIAAMIFAIGILSDDAVVMIENIARYFEAAGRKSVDLAVAAVAEVGNPTIVATFTILASLLPTAFISGEMGQYTRPLPVGSSSAMFFSLVVALTVTPYLALRFLPGRRAPAQEGAGAETDASPGLADEQVPERMDRFYRRLLTPFLERPGWRWALYGGSVILLALALSLVVFRVVPVTLLLQGDSQTLVIAGELPQRATVEESVAAGTEVASRLLELDAVQGYQLYAGQPGPLIFPGLPRSVPETPPNRFELHVRLVPEDEREHRSREVARTLRPLIRAALAPYRADFSIEASPTGPPTRAPVVAEIYGPEYAGQLELAEQIREAFEAEAALTEVDVIPEPARPRLWLEVDYPRAMSLGVPTAAVARAVRIVLAGETAGYAELPQEPEPVPIRVGTPRRARTGPGDLQRLYLPSAGDAPVPLADVARFVTDTADREIHRKDLLPVVYVGGELAEQGVETLNAQLAMGARLESLQGPDGAPPRVSWFGAPDETRRYGVAWSGEWELTYEVYRDLGFAAVGAVLLIYVLLVGWFRSFVDPVIIMVPIPLAFIGVVPAHWLAGLSISGLGTLGVIALAGIVARNSILLVEFARERLQAGRDLEEAVIQAGAVRTRPVLLTALTVILGSGVLILDPTLKGLGLTLASGALVTTLLTLLMIPIIYHHVHARARRRRRA